GHGSKANHLVAFLRRLEGTNLLVIVPRLVGSLLGEAKSPPIGPEVWEDTYILLPSCNCSKLYCNVFTGEVLEPRQARELRMDASAGFAEFPVALFLNQEIR
ncbi:MAG: hypothetical protein WCB59_11900, partial [Candidatus Sulfotelmatobacter sp.]